MSATLLTGIVRTADPLIALRRFLALDSVVTTGNGLAYVAFSAPLGRLLGVGQGLLLELGVLLAVYGAAVGWLASRRRPPVLPVKLVVEVNYAWAALSLVSLAVWFTPTTAGLLWIPVQAAVVAGFAVAQQLALRSVAQ
uniref:Integral membrane protein n=1 Tax=Streptomyces sp. NBC_00049 TaxID=2903617 RepID=A0AAU2JY96_9ACTN